MKQVLLTIFFFNFLFGPLSWAKVDPPNYNFSIDKFKVFMPDSSLEEIQKIFGQGELAYTDGAYRTFKFYVDHVRYKFPVLVQLKENKVLDFHARLPAYFLHDIFHQSLINRIGKQNLYNKVDEHAVYIWNNVENNRHTYAGACSITCFPIYYAVESLAIQDLTGYVSTLNRLRNEKKQ